MGSRRFTLKASQACPQCGNRTAFVLRCCQVSEDCCETWAECGQCGFDPTAENTGERVESVMGDLDAAAALEAHGIWEDLVAAKSPASESDADYQPR